MQVLQFPIVNTTFQTCYPTKEAAFVAHCNNPQTDAAEMLIKIEKVSIDCIRVVALLSSTTQ